jgi:hypothetical protein
MWNEQIKYTNLSPSEIDDGQGLWETDIVPFKDGVNMFYNQLYMDREG